VKTIIVQDKIRLKNLQIENNPKNKDSFILPLSSFKKTIKSNHKNNIRLPNRTYLPTKKNYTLVLIGSCVKWSMIDEVISTLNNWP